ncbi:Fat storage-inducing transmembrane protein 1 [Nibea albiflora]|nr:Fat storage-inducing transmembrane protein 1 [Nibea albiflora]
MFLRSGWGWTCVFVGSFVFLLSFSIRRSVSLSMRHLSRLAVAGGLWVGFCKLLDLLENATGSCYEPLLSGPESNANGQPLLVLREGESKFMCLRAGMQWRGFPTQLLGGALGCLSWRGLYQGWYRWGPSWFCPGRPGLGLLNTKTNCCEEQNAKLNHDHSN